MMASMRRFAFAVFAACSAVVACQLIAGIDDRDLWDGGPGFDGSPDPCTLSNLPKQPDPSTSQPTDNVTIVAALSQVLLGSSDGGPYYGFNLDKTCTCPEPDSCNGALPDGGKHCDDPNGIDDYARRAFEQINVFASIVVDGGILSEQKLDEALTTGLSGALIQISGYNGQKDDYHVKVTVYASQGIEGYPDAAPKFDGNDRWVLDPSSADGGYNTNEAYVTNYTLVATGLDFPIVIGSAVTQPVTIKLNYGVLTASLDLDAGGVMTGTLGGRWYPEEFLPSLQAVPDPLAPGNFLCGDSGTYKLIKNIICSSTDIPRDPSLDNGAGACDAVSMGLNFVARPAQLGNPGNYVDAGIPCGPGWSDSCF